MRDSYENKIMGRAEVLDRAVMILRFNLKKFILFSLVTALIVFFVAIVSAIVVTGIMLNSPRAFSFLFVILGVLLFGGLIFSFNVGMINISAQDFLGREIGVSEAVGKSLSSFFRVLKLLLLIFLYSIPVLLIFVAGGYFIFSLLSGYLIQGQWMGSFQAVLIVLLLFAGYIGALAYFTLFCFSFHTAFLGEKKGTFAAVRDSFRLARSNFRETYGMFLLAIFIPLAINSSLEGLSGIFSSLIYLLLRVLNIDVNFFNFVATFYNGFRIPVLIVNILVVSNLTMIVLTVFYFNRRFIDQGYDLKQKLSRLRNRGEEE
ncbi:MAG: hypothetical protein ACOCQC_01400 [Halanaerobiaceae bacterium]